MASGGNVVIRLATEYASKGLEMMKNGLASLGKLGLKTVSAMTTAFGGLFSSLGSALGGFMGQLGQLGQMIAQGGIWGAAQFAVSTAINKIVEKMNEAKEAAKEAAKDMANSFVAAAGKIKGSFKDLVGQLGRNAALNGAMRGVQDAESGLGTAQANADIDSDMWEKLAQARTEQEKAVILANAELEKKLIAQSDQVERATRSKAAADEAVDRAQALVSEAHASAAALIAEREDLVRKKMEAAIADDEESFNTISEALQKWDADIAEMQQKEKEATDALALAKLSRAELQARIQAEEVTAAAEVGKAERDLKDALEQRAQAEFDATIEAGHRQQELNDQINRWMEDTQARLDKEELERQQRDIEDEMDAERDRAAQEQQLFQKKIADLLQEIADIEKNREKTSRGMGVDAGRNQWGQYQYHFDKDGKISFSEWQRTRRYGDETSDEAKARRRREIEDKRMEELEDKWKSGKKLSDSEMKKLGAWWDYQEEVNGKDKKQAQIEKLQQEMANAAKKSEQHLKDLRDDLETLVKEGPLD